MTHNSQIRRHDDKRRTTRQIELARTAPGCSWLGGYQRPHSNEKQSAINRPNNNMNRSVWLAALSSLLINRQVLAFVPQQHASPRHALRIRSSPINAPEEEPVLYDILTELPPQQKQQQTGTPINGWVPKDDYALWGLPGAIPPMGFFDPLGFARQGLPLNDAKRLREAEVQHGRVAMIAVVGYFAGEAFRGPFGITGPANDQLQQVPAPAFGLLTIAIAAAELYRANKGWVEPKFKIGSNTLWTLRDDYYPGDLGFDPLGWKPTENYAFQRMQTKELSNGRLAMLGWAGICAQELVNHRTIADTFHFYQKVYSGGNPYL